MRSLLLLTALLALTACNRGERPPAGGTGPRTTFSGDSALAYIRTAMAFGTRVPGSEGHRRTGEWIVEQMRQRADTVVVQEWTHVTVRGDSLPMRNVLARFRPEATDRVLYLTHWDTRPVSENAAAAADRRKPVPGANDGTSGIGLLVALADVLRKTPPTVGVDLLFVDGEDYGDFDKNQDVFIGSRWFANHLPSPDYRPLYGVLWDMIGDADLQIYHEEYSVQRAPEVVARVWRTAEELGYARYFVQQPKYAIKDDHIPLLDKGLRVIDVIDFDYGPNNGYHHSQLDTLDKLSAQSLQVVGDVATTLVTGTE